MDQDDFIGIVAREAGIDREEARCAAQATLQTLADRISPGEARDLAARVPPELAPWLASSSAAEPFDVDEFLRRVAERASVDESADARVVRAVFDALARAAGDDELRDVAAQLPKDYAFLLPRGRYVGPLPAVEFVRRVGGRAGLDEERARHATDAVLEALAERIAGGEVDDLISRVPPELHEPLKRGRASSHGEAVRMALDEFVDHVAEREGVTDSVARDHVAAVMATLREAVGDDEFFDVTSQLPNEYDAVLAR
jgi:uncharacterized protein (DUF2267 family)